MNTEEEEIYKKALEHWGAETQASMAMGECGELIAELNRFFIQGRDNLDKVIGEIADVEIMLGQLKHMLGKEAVSEAKKNKLNRLNDIIDGKVHHCHKGKAK